MKKSNNRYSDAITAGKRKAATRFSGIALLAAVAFTPATHAGLNDAASAPVPVPAAAGLFGSGLLGLAGIARRRQLSEISERCFTRGINVTNPTLEEILK